MLPSTYTRGLKCRATSASSSAVMPRPPPTATTTLSGPSVASPGGSSSPGSSARVTVSRRPPSWKAEGTPRRNADSRSACATPVAASRVPVISA